MVDTEARQHGGKQAAIQAGAEHDDEPPMHRRYQVRKGQQVQLAFAINLGLVTKIHRRTAIVAHVTRGGTGLMMEQFAGR